MAWILFIGLLVFFIIYDIMMEHKLRKYRSTELKLRETIEELEQRNELSEAKKKRGKQKDQ